MRPNNDLTPECLTVLEPAAGLRTSSEAVRRRDLRSTLPGVAANGRHRVPVKAALVSILWRISHNVAATAYASDSRASAPGLNPYCRSIPPEMLTAG